MSRLIEALNRLQPGKTECHVFCSSSSQTEGDISSSAGLSSREPEGPQESPTPHQLDDLPRFDLPLMDWLTILRHEYLAGFVREGGGAVKVAVFSQEESLRTCQQELDNLGSRESYAIAKLDSRFTKIHLVERLFHKIAKQVDWDMLAYRFVAKLLEEHGHHLPEHRHEFSLNRVASLNERKEPMLRRDIQTWIEQTIENDSGLCREFRMAMMALCLAQLDAGESDKVLAHAVKEWLCGDLRLVSGVKKALIYQKVSRHNARHMLSSLTRWVRMTGQGGLLLTLDLSRYFGKKEAGAADGTLTFTPSATMDLYELLRQCIDSADEMEGLLMVVLAPKDFLLDTRRGVHRYEALKTRVWDDISPRHRQNPLASLVRIQEVPSPAEEQTRKSPRLVQQDLTPDGAARRTIEGLRAGVPNQHVVTTLGCLQPEVESRFQRLLEAAQQNVTAGICPRGMVVEGPFGSGKSHVLEYLQHLALQSHFICSRIVISKETPFYHPVRLFYSAIEGAVVPQKRGEIFSEIAGECETWKPRYKELVAWVNHPDHHVDARFAATLLLYERLRTDMELGYRMTRFWSGDPIAIGELKRLLQEAGFGEQFTFGNISAMELARQRFQFAARLIQAAGYAGWILLIDEAELIGRYSISQRAKSYAEVARLMSADGEASLPGVGTVLALTDDFRKNILEEKGDGVKIPEQLRLKPTDADRVLADQTEKGITLLNTQRIPMGHPSPDMIHHIYEEIRELHLKGHGWHMWEHAVDNGATIVSGTSMRHYVKSWVTHWDSLCFDPVEDPELGAGWKVTDPVPGEDPKQSYQTPISPMDPEPESRSSSHSSDWPTADREPEPVPSPSSAL